MIPVKGKGTPPTMNIGRKRGSNPIKDIFSLEMVTIMKPTTNLRIIKVTCYRITTTIIKKNTDVKNRMKQKTRRGISNK